MGHIKVGTGSMILLKRAHPEPEQQGQDAFAFLRSEGEAAQLIRQKNWSETSIGPAESWPQALKHALAICLNSKFASFIWWGEDLVQFYNDASIPTLKEKHPRALGIPAKESWYETWSEIEPAIGEVISKGEPLFFEDFETVPERDSTLDSAWFTFCCTPLFEEDGEVAGILITCMETTSRVIAEAELRESNERLSAIIDSAREYAIVTFDREGRITSWNKGAEHLLGYSQSEIIGKHGSIFFTPEDREAGVPEIEMTKAREQGRAADERWHMRKDGSMFWGSGLMLPIEGHKRDRYLKIFRDNTKRRRSAERQRMLNNELNHRVKNMMAIVQSVAVQTLRQAGCNVEVRDKLESRLTALARANDKLTASDWSGGDLRETIEDALRPVFQDSLDTRVHLRGPELHLNAGAVLGLSLALHELATNALKYGSMSNDTGRVEVCWEIEGDHLVLQWIESGGPPVETPSRRGFGSRVIEEELAREFEGKVSAEFKPDGLVCMMKAPLEALVDGK